MIRLLVCISITFALAGCATPDGLYTQYRRDPLVAAGADIITTEIALSRPGMVELNPMGLVGAVLAKGVYLFAIRPQLEAAARADSDRLAASLWYGAAANNLCQILVPGVALASLAVGVGVGWHLYRE
jgi:hypothetical protein